MEDPGFFRYDRLKTYPPGEKIIMHPAAKAHITGMLSIIRTGLAQIECAMAADDAGHQSAEALGAKRAEREVAGNESAFLDDASERVLKDGFAELWKQAQVEEVDATVTDEIQE